MHMIIRAIVYAEDKQEALSNAKVVFEGLCNNKDFDYYGTFDEKYSKERWGPLPVVVEALSPEGKKLITEGMKSTKKEFKEHLKSIRTLLAQFTNEELFEQKSKVKLNNKLLAGLKFFKYHCNCCGSYSGSNTWLYDNDGSGIRDTRHLKDALNKWDDKKYKHLKVYVVPADVHF